MKRYIAIFSLVLLFLIGGCISKEKKPDAPPPEETKKEEKKPEDVKKPAVVTPEGKLYLRLWVDKYSGWDFIRFSGEFSDGNVPKEVEGVKVVVEQEGTEAVQKDLNEIIDFPVKKETRSLSELKGKKVSFVSGDGKSKLSFDLEKDIKDITIKVGEQIVINPISITKSSPEKIELTDLKDFIGKGAEWRICELDESSGKCVQDGLVLKDTLEVSTEGKSSLNLEPFDTKVRKGILILSFIDTKEKWQFSDKVFIYPQIIVIDSVDVEFK